jgi:uncharacterized membrane protein YdjX (TVP38/TMEM64 family)
VTRKLIVRGLPMLLVLAAVAYLLELSHQAGLLDKSGMDIYLRHQGLAGQLLFLTLGAAFTAVGVPRQLISFLAGYGFGLIWGVMLALTATVLGCVMAFGVARAAGRAWVAARMPRRMRALETFIHENTFATTLLIRLLPAGNNLLTNLAGGVSGVRAVPFLSGSALGFLPQTVVFALLGSGESLDPAVRSLVAIVLFLGSGLLGLRLFARYRDRHQLPPQMQRALDAELEAAQDAQTGGDRS